MPNGFAFFNSDLFFMYYNVLQPSLVHSIGSIIRQRNYSQNHPQPTKLMRIARPKVYANDTQISLQHESVIGDTDLLKEAEVIIFC